MRHSIRFILLFIASASLLCMGCRRVNNVVWSKYASIPPEGWDPVNVIPFFPWPEDSVNNPSDRYSLLLSVRFSILSNPAPLHLAIHQEDEEGRMKSDTIMLTLSPPEETPVGKGSYVVYETVDTIDTGIPLRAGYCVELQSLSVPENTRGIMDIGLILSEDNNENKETLFKKIQNFRL
ncbi:MAG: gliding motility lipoprotein GldH [Muribaculaceae bacterium]|nr:gliding motility lipoprotein GldH [Muribaculaceae bacterium]